MISAKYVFPAIQGVQAGNEYYVSMVPIETIPKLFMFSEDDLPVEIRAQRTLNKSRVPEICNYMIENRNSYVFSALTASVDGEMEFDIINPDYQCLGQLSISMDARFLINDGQHRRAAIELALRECPDLKGEHISIVFLRDQGLQRAQQIFSDLNKYAIKPTKSLNILFDGRDDYARLVKTIIRRISVFDGFVEKEKTTLSNRSKALFTLSSIYQGTEELLKGIDISENELEDFAIAFWQMVAENMLIWQKVKNGEVKSSEIRRTSVCSLSMTIIALGQVGNMLIREFPSDWKVKIQNLRSISWEKDASIWSNNIVVNGKVISSRSTQKTFTDILYRLIKEGQDGTYT